MEKVLNIGEKEVKFKSTAGTMLRYRSNFNRDFMKDLRHLQVKLTEKKENNIDFEVIDLEMFERIAWCMAKTADNSIPDIEHWLDDFETFDIIKILPELMTLLVNNMKTITPAKKKISSEEM